MFLTLSVSLSCIPALCKWCFLWDCARNSLSYLLASDILVTQMLLRLKMAAHASYVHHPERFPFPLQPDLHMQLHFNNLHIFV